jgi:drug/metabolite transporter (DMT)-like permease
MHRASGASARSSFSPSDAGLLLLLASMWGFSFLFIKVGVGEVSPLWVVASRTVVASVVLLVILRVRGRRLPRQVLTWLNLLVLAAASNILPWAVVAWAEQFIPSGIAAVLNSLTPLVTLAVAALIGLERMTGTKIAGLVIAFGGTAIIVSGELTFAGRAIPSLAVVGATLFYAIGAVYAKRYVSGTEPPLVIATGQVVVAAIVSVPIAWAVGPTPVWADLSLAAVGSLLALGTLGTGLAFLLFYMLIERVGATNATMVTYLIPVVGLVAGWAILGERFGPHVLIGAAVIIVGIWLAQRRRPEATPTSDDLVEMEQPRG